MKVLIESMTRIEMRKPNVVIRVWRQEESFDTMNRHSTQGDVMNALSATELNGFNEIASAVLALERVNAVEVLDQYGDGVVLYKDWP